jgi:hypothetical protein
MDTRSFLSVVVFSAALGFSVGYITVAYLHPERARRIEKFFDLDPRDPPAGMPWP